MRMGGGEDGEPVEKRIWRDERRCLFFGARKWSYLPHESNLMDDWKRRAQTAHIRTQRRKGQHGVADGMLARRVEEVVLDDGGKGRLGVKAYGSHASRYSTFRLPRLVFV